MAVDPNLATLFVDLQLKWDKIKKESQRVNEDLKKAIDSANKEAVIDLSLKKDALGGQLHDVEAQVKKTFSAMKGEAEKAKSSMGSVFAGVKESWAALPKSLVGGAAGFVAADAIIGTIKQLSARMVELTKEVDSEMMAERRLGVALGYNSELLVKYAKSEQLKTRFTDDAILSAEAMLAAYVKNEDQILRLMPVIEDFATATGTDLTSAAQMVAKTVGSSVDAFARWGIKVDGAAGSAERVNDLIQKMNGHFKDQAKAVAGIGLGPLEQQQKALENIEKAFAEKIIPFMIKWKQLQLDIVGAMAEWTGTIKSDAAQKWDKEHGLDYSEASWVKGINQITGKAPADPQESAKIEAEAKQRQLDAEVKLIEAKLKLGRELSAEEEKRVKFLKEYSDTYKETIESAEIDYKHAKEANAQLKKADEERYRAERDAIEKVRQESDEAAKAIYEKNRDAKLKEVDLRKRVAEASRNYDKQAFESQKEHLDAIVKDDKRSSEERIEAIKKLHTLKLDYAEKEKQNIIDAANAEFENEKNQLDTTAENYRVQLQLLQQIRDAKIQAARAGYMGGIASTKEATGAAIQSIEKDKMKDQWGEVQDAAISSVDGIIEAFRAMPGDLAPAIAGLTSSLSNLLQNNVSGAYSSLIGLAVSTWTKVITMNKQFADAQQQAAVEFERSALEANNAAKQWLKVQGKEDYSTYTMNELKDAKSTANEELKDWLNKQMFGDGRPIVGDAENVLRRYTSLKSQGVSDELMAAVGKLRTESSGNLQKDLEFIRKRTYTNDKEKQDQLYDFYKNVAFYWGPQEGQGLFALTTKNKEFSAGKQLVSEVERIGTAITSKENQSIDTLDPESATSMPGAKRILDALFNSGNLTEEEYDKKIADQARKYYDSGDITFEDYLLYTTKRKKEPDEQQVPDGVPVFDDGGIVTKPTFAMLAKNSRPEVVLPLDKPDRILQILDRAGVFGASSQRMAIDVTVRGEITDQGARRLGEIIGNQAVVSIRSTGRN